ncbi:MAG: ABC transporter permease, partial [Bacillota bacterium]
MRSHPLLWAAALAVYALLYIPLAVVVLFSFNDSALNAQWAGFTTRWYAVLARDADMLAAAANSLAIATLSALLSTLLGTMAGIALQRYRLRLLGP